MQNQPVMGVQAILLGHSFEQVQLHFQRVFARGHSGAIADAKNMRINRHGRMTENYVHHNISSFAPNARQGRERVAIFGNLPAEIINQFLRQADNVFGFILVKPDGLDVIANGVFTQREHFFRRVGDFKKLFGRFIHPGVRRLRG